ncbi:MAG TPA: hypothetical protein GXZ96_02595 [Firmicutes bacterium]|jgi:hypothetical protein|nr:hypothetical protein [Bacillota bacterium]
MAMVLYLAILVLLVTATLCLLCPRVLQRIVIACEQKPQSVRGMFLASPQYLLQLEITGLVSLILALLLIIWRLLFL